MAESSVRSRKGRSTPRQQYNVRIQEDHSKNSDGWSCPIKLAFILLLLTSLLTVNAFWPAPEFSDEVRRWKDDGVYFRYNKHEIFYQDIRLPDYDPDSDPVLLAVHGFPTSSFDWKPSLPRFRKYFQRIIIPDLLGLGFSSKPFPYNYTIAEHADIITELLKSLSIKEIHIISQDIGDNIVQELLSRQQDSNIAMEISVKGICLSDGPVLSTHYKHRPLQKLLLIPSLQNIVPFLINRYLFMWRFNAVTGVPLPRRALENIYAILMYNDGHRSAPYVLNYIPEIFAIGPKWEKALEETNIPVHLIFGPHDPSSSYGEFLDVYKRRFPHSSITYIENAGHFINLEVPEKFADGFEEYARKIL